MASSDPHGKRGTAKAIDARLFRGSNLRRSDHAREHTIPCRARHSQRAASDADRLAGSCRSQLNPRLGIQPGHTGSGAVAGSGGGRRTADCLPVQHVPPGSARFRLRRWPACLSFDVPPAARRCHAPLPPEPPPAPRSKRRCPRRSRRHRAAPVSTQRSAFCCARPTACCKPAPTSKAAPRRCNAFACAGATTSPACARCHRSQTAGRGR